MQLLIPTFTKNNAQFQGTSPYSYRHNSHYPAFTPQTTHTLQRQHTQFSSKYTTFYTDPTHSTTQDFDSRNLSLLHLFRRKTNAQYSGVRISVKIKGILIAEIKTLL